MMVFNIYPMGTYRRFQDMRALLNRIFFMGLLLLAAARFGWAQTDSAGKLPEPIVISLWESSPPFSTMDKAERTLPANENGVTRITDVSNPTLSIYPNKRAEAPSPAMIILPGGGYKILAIDLEGTEIASWARSLGFTPVIVKYRVPRQRKAAFADLQRAMSILRHDAAQWNIQPDKIGVIGFSAGGNLAARLSTHYKKRIYPPADAADSTPLKPDFSILVYPAYMVGKNMNLQPEVALSNPPPPSFIIQTQDDHIGYQNSLFYYHALSQQDIPAELHLFPEGGHGYGMRVPDTLSLANWPGLTADWLRSIAIIE